MLGLAPVSPNTVLSVYSGLVPMSPNTTPRAEITKPTLLPLALMCDLSGYIAQGVTRR